MFDLVVRGGRVVTAREDYVADIAVSGGTSAAASATVASHVSSTIQTSVRIMCPPR